MEHTRLSRKRKKLVAREHYGQWVRSKKEWLRLWGFVIRPWVEAGKRYEGTTEAYFETGTEGIIWSVVIDGKFEDRREALRSLCKGDKLTVLGKDGMPLWEGVIDYDWRTGYEKYPLNPALGQQVALGAWVHGVQKGFKPNDWAKLFFEPKRCILIKGPRNDIFADADPVN